MNLPFILIVHPSVNLFSQNMMNINIFRNKECFFVDQLIELLSDRFLLKQPSFDKCFLFVCLFVFCAFFVCLFVFFFVNLVLKCLYLSYKYKWNMSDSNSFQIRKLVSRFVFSVNALDGWF